MKKKIFALIISLMMTFSIIPTIAFAGTPYEENQFTTFRTCRILSYVEPIKTSKYSLHLNMTPVDQTIKKLEGLNYDDSKDLAGNQNAILDIVSNLYNTLIEQHKVLTNKELDNQKNGEDADLSKIIDDSKKEITDYKFVYDPDYMLDKYLKDINSIADKCYVNINNYKLLRVAAKSITSKKAALTKLTASKKKIKISVKAISVGENKITVYQVYRSTNKNFKKGLKKYTVKLNDLSKSTLSYTDTKSLKKGTKYFYKVRGVVKGTNGKPIYTKWSENKSIKSK